MSRHVEPMGPLDDPGAENRDPGFVGFRSRTRPEQLPPGVARYIENMRLDQQTARVRKGTKALATDLAEAPVVLDYPLAADFSILDLYRTGSTVTVECNDLHELEVGDDVVIYGSDIADYNGQWTVTAVNSTSEFEFDIGAATPASYPSGTIWGNAGPPLQETYSSQVIASLEYADSSNAEGVVLATAARAYVYRAGESTAEVDYPSGQTLDATVGAWMVQAGGYVYLYRDASSYVMRWDMNVANDFTQVLNGAHPNGGTFIYTPNVAWGVLWTRQLVIPYARTQFLRSGFSEFETFDTLYSQQNIRSGGDDWLMFVHGYQRQRLVVFYRKSMYLARFFPDTMAPESVDTLSNQAGLVARATVQECGDLIVWLADDGLRVMRIVNELELELKSSPLSEPIQDLFDRINPAYAHRAVGRYWDNRYYLAVPLDDATTNDHVLVFNFLNRTSGNPEETGFYGEWESVDTFTQSFDVQNFLVLGYSNHRRLHYATTYGFLFLAEELDVDEYGVLENVADYTIVGKLNSRYYFGGNSRQKQLTEVGVEMEAWAANDGLQVTVGTRNRDLSRVVETVTASAAGDISVNKRVRRMRGTAGYVDIETSAGRPEIKSIELQATERGGRRETKE